MGDVGIVIPTLINFRGLAECLASLKTNTSYKLYIMDNWERNRSVSQSWNEGAKRAISDGCDYIAFLNDDIIMSDNLIDELHIFLRDAESYSGCGLVSAVRASRGALNKHGGAEVAKEGSPDFACFMMTKECFGVVGDFDENIKPAYFEDNDYHYRCILLGVSVYSLEYAKFFTEGSVTQNWDSNNPVVSANLFVLNRLYYNEKWGGNPGEEMFLNPYNDASLSPDQWIQNFQLSSVAVILEPPD